jgi:hypothetical protein
MKRALLLFCILTLHIFSYAQFLVTKVNEDFYLQYDNGALVNKVTSFTEEGSATIPATNCKVVFKTTDAKLYKNVYGRLDLLSQKLIFSLNGKELLCTLPIAEIIIDSCNSLLNGAVFKNGYPPIDKQTAENFYQVLNQGKATLLKYYQIQWRDEVPYNSTNTTRVYDQSVHYYLYLNNRMHKLDKNNKNLPALLGKTVAQLSLKKLDLKKEQDMVELIRYYNNL